MKVTLRYTDYHIQAGHEPMSSCPVTKISSLIYCLVSTPSIRGMIAACMFYHSQMCLHQQFASHLSFGVF
jgi:hypothetical protein